MKHVQNNILIYFVAGVAAKINKNRVRRIRVSFLFSKQSKHAAICLTTIHSSGEHNTYMRYPTILFTYYNFIYIYRYYYIKYIYVCVGTPHPAVSIRLIGLTVCACVCIVCTQTHTHNDNDMLAERACVSQTI